MSEQGEVDDLHKVAWSLIRLRWENTEDIDPASERGKVMAEMLDGIDMPGLVGALVRVGAVLARGMEQIAVRTLVIPPEQAHEDLRNDLIAMHGFRWA